MIKEILITSSIITTLMLSGCSDNGQGEKKLEIQQMLDKGDYQGVTDSLGEGENASEYMLLGAAYMGKAGVGIPDLIDIVIESGDSNDDSVFGSFIGSLAEKTKNNPNALADLQRSTDFYNQVMDKNCSNNTNLSVSEKDVCLFTGLSQTVKAATTISYMADDVSQLSDDNGESDSKLTASVCAMQYAADGNITGTKCTINKEDNVTFSESNKTYETIIAITNGESFEYLIKAKSPSVTNGFCNLENFTSRVPDKNATSYDESTFHVCPVDTSSDITTSISMTKVLVEALNDGTGAIGNTGTEDTKESIDEFKCEVLGGTFQTKTCIDANINDSITEEQVINYLNKNN